MMHSDAIAGGRPLSDTELETLAHDQLVSLRQTFAARPTLAKTDDLVSQRLAEELRLVSRMIELAQERASSGSIRTLAVPHGETCANRR